MTQIQYLNNKAKEIHTNPHIIIDDMSMDEFAEWLKINDTKYCDTVVLENLINLLIEYEMYEHCELVKQRLNNL
jgi:hypothetical protein